MRGCEVGIYRQRHMSSIKAGHVRFYHEARSSTELQDTACQRTCTSKAMPSVYSTHYDVMYAAIELSERRG